MNVQYILPDLTHYLLGPFLIISTLLSPPLSVRHYFHYNLWVSFLVLRRRLVYDVIVLGSRELSTMRILQLTICHAVRCIT